MLINRYFSVFRTAASGLEAQRKAMGAASENIANASTTRTADGTPYAIKRAVHEAPTERYQQFSTMLNEMQTKIDTSDPRHLKASLLRDPLADSQLGPTTEIQAEERVRLVYDPKHPHADENGYVSYPDINVVDEMARMISANRIYEANLSTVQAAKEMIKRTLEI